VFYADVGDGLEFLFGEDFADGAISCRFSIPMQNLREWIGSLLVGRIEHDHACLGGYCCFEFGGVEGPFGG
jgi:hypothetical protein